MGTGEFDAGGKPAMDKYPIQGKVKILLVASCYRNRDKLRTDGPHGSYVAFTKARNDSYLLNVTHKILL